MAAPIENCELSYFQELFRCLQILTTSSASRQNISEGESLHLIENVLLQNMKSFTEWLTSCDVIQTQERPYAHLRKFAEWPVENSHDQIRRNFADLSVATLKSIIKLASKNDPGRAEDAEGEKTHHETTSQPGKDFLLSVEQKRVLASSLQFVVVLGVSPYLCEGIGIPISHRLGPGQILLASAHDYSQAMSEVRRFHSLLPALQLLVDAFHNALFRETIVKNHLSDLITILIQMRRTAKIILQHYQKCSYCDSKEFHPEAKSAEELDNRAEQKHSLSSLSSSPSDTASIESIDRTETVINEKCCHDMISYCNQEMHYVFTQHKVPTLLQELLSLAGHNKANKNIKRAPWFKRVIVCIIRDILMQPLGVLRLISPLVSESPSYDTKNWKTCEAMARVISLCPVNENNVREFYSSVSKQLIDLIRVRENPAPKALIKIVGETVSQLANQQRDLIEEFCLAPLKAPLLRCCSYDGLSSTGDILVSEKELMATISLMHRLYVQGQTYQSHFCSTLQPTVSVLFAIFKHVKNGVSQLRSLTRDLVGSYVACLDSTKAAACLLELLVPREEPEGLYPPLHPQLVLMSGCDAGLQVVVASEQHSDIKTWLQSSEAVLELLTHLKSDSLTSDLFISLLQKLTSVISSEAVTCEDIQLPSHCLSTKAKSETLNELKGKTALVSLISAIGEKYGHTVIANTHHVLLFTQITLKRCLEVYKASDDVTTLSFEEDTVTMVMGLLMATLSLAQELSDEDKKVLDDLLLMLSAISQSGNMPFHVKEMANSLKVVVTTRGRVWPDPPKQEAEQESLISDTETKLTVKTEGKKSSGTKPLIEVLEEKNFETPAPKVQEVTKSNAQPEAAGPKNPFRQALDDSSSPLLPVQGHGLISLTRMLEERQTDAIQQKDGLFKIFMKNLSHLDSYIYLASVNGLSALTDLCPDDVVPCLCSEFRSLCVKVQDPPTIETTLKVGEALVKASRRLGEMIPKYRDDLLPAILCGCRHGNELVRASCLSGLAEVCKLLRFAVNPVLQEVLTCCCDVIKSDPCCEPRKAAALMITSLLQGLGKDSLETLNLGLRDLYHALKHAVNFDPDEKVKMNATLALNELEDIMKSVLFPDKKLQKTISILGYQ